MTQQPPVPAEKPSFSDTAQQWIIQYGQILLYGFAAALFAAFIYARFFSADREASVEEYTQAASAYTTFASPLVQATEPAKWEEAFATLQQSVARLPNLNQKYDAPIAQVLLAKGFSADAATFADPAFARIEADQIPLYPAYAHTSFLIGEKQFDQALANALELQEAMDKGTFETPQFGPQLYMANLLRIAALHEALGQQSEQIATIERILALGENAPFDREIARRFIALFGTGDASLQSFLSHIKSNK